MEPNALQKQRLELGEDSGIWQRNARTSEAQLDLGRVLKAGQLNDAEDLHGVIVQRRVVDDRELAGQTGRSQAKPRRRGFRGRGEGRDVNAVDWRAVMCGVRGEGGVDSARNGGAGEPDLGDANPEAYPAAREQAGLGGVGGGGEATEDAAEEVVWERAEAIFLAAAGGEDLDSPPASAAEIHGDEWGADRDPLGELTGRWRRA